MGLFWQVILSKLCDVLSNQTLHYIPMSITSYNKHVFTSKGENSVDPDQLASQKPADLDLHCFQNWIYPTLAW